MCQSEQCHCLRALLVLSASGQMYSRRLLPTSLPMSFQCEGREKNARCSRYVLGRTCTRSTMYEWCAPIVSHKVMNNECISPELQDQLLVSYQFKSSLLSQRNILAGCNNSIVPVHMRHGRSSARQGSSHIRQATPIALTGCESATYTLYL